MTNSNSLLQNSKNKAFFSAKFALTALVMCSTVSVCSAATTDSRPEDQNIQSYLGEYDGQSPVFMAHRMSPTDCYAENSLVTLGYYVDKYPHVIQEIDVRISSDGIAVLNHDTTLERTSTGSGELSDYTYAQLQEFKLKTADGTVLDESIPLLEDALNIIKGKAVTMLDMKPGTDPDIMMSIVEKTGTMDDVIVICYSIEQGQYIYQTYPGVMIALGYNGAQSVEDYKQANIALDNIVALISGRIMDSSYYQPAIDNNIPMSFSAQTGMDKAPNAMEQYRQVYPALGITILCTDSLENAINAFKK